MDVEEQKKTLWLTVRKLGNNLNPELHKQLVLGLVFLKYLTCFEDVKPNEDLLEEERLLRSKFSADEGKTNLLQGNIANSDIAALVDKEINAIENSNKNLAGVFYKHYSNPDTDKQSLSEFINLLEVGSFKKTSLLQKESLAQLFGFLLTKFKESERQKQGKIYPSDSIIRLLVQIVDPRKGKIYDGCCGTGELFVQTEKFIRKYKGKIDGFSLSGQDNNAVNLQIAKMNLIMHDLTANLQYGDCLTNDCFPGLAADYILSAPQSNPAGQNEDYAWLQHFTSKLSAVGTAGILLKAASTNSSKAEDSKIRKNLVEDKIVDCVVSLPAKLFTNADAPLMIWILSKIETNSRYTKAGNEILFINAGKLRFKKNERNGELPGEHIVTIARTYQRWKNITGDYIDIKGFCKSVSYERIRKNGYSLTPEKYLKRRNIKIVLPALLMIVGLAWLYFSTLQPTLSASKPKTRDSAILARPQILKDSIQSEKKLSAKERGEIKDSAAQTNINHFHANIHSGDIKNPSVVSNQPISTNQPASTVDAAKAKNANGVIKYKVNSTAYFYNEPDESTRRKAFITHWNNSYADIAALDEKNNFIYVVFTNHLHQQSKGWLRKKDLREVKP